MKKTVAIIMAGTVAFSVFTGCSININVHSPSDTSSVSDWDVISNKGSLIIGMSYFEPMNFFGEDSKLTGFETEFATAVCGELGVTPVFQEIEWDSKEIELKAKTIDCIWNGFTITEERNENMDFSVPYMQNEQVVVMKAENIGRYKTADDLKGAKVVVESGSAGEKVVQFEDFFREATCTPADSQAKCLLEVKSGTSDIAVIDYALTVGVLCEGGDYTDLRMAENMTFAPELYGAAFRKGSPETIKKVNVAISKLDKEGKLHEIAEKYHLADHICTINIEEIG
ncbi:MAG: transporter substrate-binding domain-containing protein [Ruminococcus sp.]|nr:transporter substrate-binding domain-containing protein [Ruminococcus sp.]